MLATIPFGKAAPLPASGSQPRLDDQADKVPGDLAAQQELEPGRVAEVTGLAHDRRREAAVRERRDIVQLDVGRDGDAAFPGE